ncbi:MAG: alpha-L-fucosidase, partial [Vicinamibacterales bacterium]
MTATTRAYLGQLAVTGLALWLMVAGATRPLSSQAAAPPDPERAKRLAWFHEAKYGLFIHWGLYA